LLLLLGLRQICHAHESSPFVVGGSTNLSPSRMVRGYPCAMSLTMPLMAPVAARASGRVWDWARPMVTAAD
jgi:hypothetical protein